MSEKQKSRAVTVLLFTVLILAVGAGFVVYLLWNKPVSYVDSQIYAKEGRVIVHISEPDPDKISTLYISHHAFPRDIQIKDLFISSMSRSPVIYGRAVIFYGSANTTYKNGFGALIKEKTSYADNGIYLAAVESNEIYVGHIPAKDIENRKTLRDVRFKKMQ